MWRISASGSILRTKSQPQGVGEDPVPLSLLHTPPPCATCRWPRASQARNEGNPVRSLFESLERDGATGVRALKGRPEELDFDCKRKKTPSHGAFEREDRQNLGIALSAFANSMGGLLLWGVEARKDSASGLDLISDFYPIRDIRRFESEARTISAEALMPRIDNVEVAAIEEPIGSGNGYLAMFVARSERRPHRCEIAEVKGYYRRSMSSSRMMEHFEIEDAFKSLLVPELDLSIGYYNAGSTSGGLNISAVSFGIEVYLTNSSNLSATFPYVSAEVGEKYSWDATRSLGLDLIKRKMHGAIYFEGNSKHSAPSKRNPPDGKANI